MPSSSSSKSLTEEKRKKWEADGYKISVRDLPAGKGEKKFKVSYSYVEDRETYNVIDDVKNIQKSTVFIAGELDTVIDPRDAKRIADNANEPKKFILLEGIGHIDTILHKSVKLTRQLLKLLLFEFGQSFYI